MTITRSEVRGRKPIIACLHHAIRDSRIGPKVLQGRHSKRAGGPGRRRDASCSVRGRVNKVHGTGRRCALMPIFARGAGGVNGNQRGWTRLHRYSKHCGQGIEDCGWPETEVRKRTRRHSGAATARSSPSIFARGTGERSIGSRARHGIGV